MEFFVEEALGIDGTRGFAMSEQQRQACREVSLLVMAKKKRMYNAPMTDIEKEYAEKLGISIMAGQGCHAKGTRILMYDGSVKNVEDVAVGELLMGNDSTPRKVLSLIRGNEKMYRVKYHFGDYYDVNESHILSLRCDQTHSNQNLGDIVNISVKDYLRKNKRFKNTHVGYKGVIDRFGVANVPLQIPPYILGVWLGDGCTGKSTIVGIDKEVIDEFKKYGDSVGLKYSTRIGKEHNINGIVNKKQGNDFINGLKHHGVFNNKRIPNEYKTASKENRLDLLAGLIDTDGHLDQRNKRVFTIIQKNELLADDIVFVARSLGFHATKKPKTKMWTWKGERKVGIYYEISITRNVHLIPTRIERKKALSGTSKQLNFGFKVEELGYGDYYGFEIDGNNLYCLDDFTVTHNTGKDGWTAWFIQWFEFCFNNVLIPCTAPSADQLKNILWTEVSRWLNRNGDDGKLLVSPLVKNSIIVQNDRIYRKASKGKDVINFAFPKTANPKDDAEAQAKTLYGFHDIHMAIVIDDAAGVLDPVFKPLEGTVTKDCNFIILLFNPIFNTGFAIETHTGPFSHKWIRLHWDAEDSELVTKQHIQDMEEKYGRESNTFRTLVKGLPPVADNDSIIPYAWVMDATKREIEPDKYEPRIGGCDPGAGGDNTVLRIRNGLKVEKVRYVFSSPSSVEVGDWAAAKALEEGLDVLYFDVIGIGNGAYYEAKKVLAGSKCKVYAVDVRNKAMDEEKYYNLNSELTYKLRQYFQDGTISIPVDQVLIEELSAPRMKRIGKKEAVEDKYEVKKRLKFNRSPNDADALRLTFAKNDAIFRHHRSDDIGYTNYNYGVMNKPLSSHNPRGWLRA
jgi:hypothetical protein